MPQPDEQIILSESRRPSRWDIRMIVSIPALVVLLVIAVGLANYWVVNDVAVKLDRLLPQYDTSYMVVRTLWIFLISTFLAVISGGAILYNFLHPIRIMSQALEKIRQGQIEQQPLKVNAGFELQQLGMNFNSLISHLNETIREREAYLNESLLAGSMLIDPEGRIRSINSTGMEILGGAEKDYVGQSLQDLQKTHESSFIAFCKRIIDSPQSISQAKVTLSPANSGEKMLSVACSVLKGESNHISGILFQFIDISRINNLNEIFSRTDHLAALGTFVFGLSHELRNPLGAIKGTAQLLSEQIDDKNSSAPFLDRIVREVDRLDRLVRELYDFSRTSGGSVAAEDLNALTAQALSEVTAGIPLERREGRQVKEQYQNALPHVYLQRNRVKRAVSNIIINAFEHMPPGSEMRLETRFETDAGAILSISNTGSHIAAKDIDRVFDPFYSTRQGGTGLGLAIAYQIVNQNHGALTVTSGNNVVSFQLRFQNIAEAPREESHA